MSDFQAGEESVLAYFVSTYSKPLRFFAYNLLRNKQVAEEIVSDSFYKLWERRQNFVLETNVKAFLYISTRNACYDYLSSPKNKIPFLDERVAWEMPDIAADLEADIVLAETIHAISREIDGLPSQQAAIFRMTYLEGLNSEEISKRLGISANAVFVSRSKALARLRTLFKGKEDLLYVALFQWVVVEKFLN